MILFQVTVGLNAAQSDTGAIQALVGGIPGGQANVTAGANTLSFTLAWDETLDGDFPSSLSFQFTGAGGNSLTFTSMSINGQSVSLGTYLDNTTINTGTPTGTITIGAPIRHFFGRQEPDVGDPTDIRANPANVLGTDLAQPGDTTANVTVLPNVASAIEGSNGRDIIYGSDFADRINAGDGDDSVAGNDGGDTLFGGAGNDMIAGGGGHDSIFGGLGDDLLFGNAGNDLLQGQAGNNVLNGGDGDDKLVGGGNNDILFGGDGSDLLSGSTGNDALYGDAGDDLLSAGAGEDTGWGGAGNDTLAGGNGNDTLYGEADDDGVLGGAGNDVLYGDDGTGVSADGADIIMGGLGNDRIYGGLGNDVLMGEAGDDTLQGQDGDDVLIGGVGTDTLDGGAGADIIYGTSIDTATATALVAQSGRTDVSFGMSGNSFYKVVLGSFDYATAAAAAAADTLINGVAGHLVVITSAAEQATVNELVAAAGGTGQFWMGGSDNAQENVWSWQGGVEATRWFSDNSGASISNFFTYWQGGVPGAEDYQALNADNNGYWTANASTATFGYIIEWDATSMSADTGADIMVGGADNDILYGSAGDKTIDGGDGGDQIFAIAGNNVLIGGAGNDLIVGGSGNDTMRGDAGNDAFDGGSGVDTYDASAAPAGMSMLNFFGVMAVTNDGYGATTELLANVENITGTAFNDTIEGNYIDNVLIGGGGTDLLTYANATGGVTVNLATTTAQNTGTTGTDTVSGFENLNGSAFNDVLTGSTSGTVDGGNGDDTLSGGSGNNVLIGGAGNDWLSYANATAGVNVGIASTNAQITSGAGTDTVSGFENIIGSAFNDTLSGNANANTFEGGAGDDTINGYAGSGTDTASYSTATGAVTVSLAIAGAQNTGSAGTDTLNSIQNLIGSAYGDTLTGDTGANTLSGGNGNDTLDGGTGNDTLVGGAGNDVITGGGGTDTVDYSNDPAGVSINLGFFGSGATDGWGGTDSFGNSIANAIGSSFNDSIIGTNANNVLSGGAGDDIFFTLAGTDTVDGGSGNDTISYFVGPGAVTIDLGAGTVSASGHSVTMTGIENAVGSAGDDTIAGSSGNNVLNGYNGTDLLTYASATGSVTVNLSTATAQNTGAAGTDTITNFENLTGSAFNDTLTGDSGNNTIEGLAGNDVLNGGTGTDTLSYGNAAAAVTVSLATTTAQNTGAAGTDTVSAFENLTGSAFNDTLTGDTGANVITGGDGNDTLTGAAGADTLDGGNGNDVFNVANGDFVSGDSITGGDGTADTIVLTTVGATADFSLGTLASVETITATTGNDVVTVMATQYAGVLSTINLGTTGTDTFRVFVSDTMNISAATAATITGSGTITGNLWGSGGDDTLTLTGAQLDAILAGVLPGISLGLGTDTINLTSNSSRLNVVATLGSGWGDALIAGVEVISASAATAAVTLNMSLQSEGMTLTGGTGADVITGGGAIDIIQGGAGNDSLYGGNGNDTITGSTGNDLIDGGAGTDTVSYSNDAAGVLVYLNWFGSQIAIDGGGTLDTLVSIESIIGSAFGDGLFGDNNANVIDGGNGNDTIDGAGGNDILSGGGGTDTLSYAIGAGTTAAVTISLAVTTGQNTGGAGTDTISGFENLIGSGYADVLTGDTAANVIDGGAGNDTISGGLGNDVLIGGTGTDTLVYTGTTAGITINLATTTAQNTGGSGTQTVSGFENVIGTAFNDTITGTTGDNTIDGGLGNDVLTGDAGIDTVSYTLSTAGVTVNLATTTAQNTGGSGTDTISGFENLIGSAFNDTLTGDGGNNLIDAGSGGNDVLTGGAGIDTVSYANATAGVTINLATTTAQNTGGNGTDTITGFENVTGSAFNDVLTSASADTLAAQVSTILAANSGVSYDATTGNFYKFINSTVSWTTANTAATTAQLTGVSGVYGHIAMPYSSYENNLLDTFTGLGTNQIWLGATDGVTEGTWLIAGGAMDGVALWIGTSGGAVQNSLWTNWNPGQPDNLSNADFIGQNDGGLWEDRDPSTNRRYIIEWDGSQVLSPTSSTTLHGGAGTDTLYGSSGADEFLFLATDGAIGTEANADKIYNFSRVQHDTINIANLLTGYTPGSSDPDAWAKFEVSGSNVVLKVDANGAAGGSNFGSSTVAAVFMGTTDLTTFNIEHMVADGFLVMG